MTRLNAVLALLLLGSALFLVHTAYEGRRLFSALDRAQKEQRQLEAAYRRLDAERQAQATNARVERVAREQLGMRSATPAVTSYVVDPAEARLAPSHSPSPLPSTLQRPAPTLMAAGGPGAAERLRVGAPALVGGAAR